MLEKLIWNATFSVCAKIPDLETAPMIQLQKLEVRSPHGWQQAANLPRKRREEKSHMTASSPRRNSCSRNIDNDAARFCAVLADHVRKYPAHLVGALHTEVFHIGLFQIE